MATKNIQYEWIARVGLNGNEKISGSSTYSDFTNATLTTLNVGVPYTLYVDVKNTWNYNEFVKAWIDFNNDGAFSSNEEINLGNATFNGILTFNKTFIVPVNATAGETRMRVYLRYGAATFACTNVTSGEVEDYKISLSPSIQACTNGLTQSCGFGNCLGIQTCTSGNWGSCTAECDAIHSCQNKCAGNVRYSSGSCTLSTCNCSYITQDCDLQDGCYAYDNGCENRDYFCQPDACNYTFSNRSTDSYDAYVNYCSADTIRTNRTFHDFGCDGTCKDHTSFVNDSLVSDCSIQNGWYNTTTAWVDDTQNTEKEQFQQEYHKFTCGPAVNCAFTVNGMRWNDTGRTRNKTSVKYCPVSIKSSCSSLPVESITRVSLNGNQTTSGSSAYSDFTNATLTTLNVGVPYTLYVDVKTPAKYTEFVKAWIDFNNDGAFSSNEEINLGNAQFYGNRTFNNTFSVPSNAVLSETRMRVYLKWAASPSPCENATFGEIEDYRIKIMQL